MKSEPLAEKIKAQQGDVITLDTPNGPERFRVFAIYFDFASDRGEALLDRSEYIRLWKDDGVGALHVRLRNLA